MSNDTINGGDGNDTIFAAAGEDVVSSGNGDDLVFGGDDNDSILGEAGDDTLNGGGGADTLDGGAGADTASYSTASTGVFVDLGNASRNTGEALGDVHTSIENLIGSNHADDLRATGGGNVVRGHAGNDFVLARSGNDSVYGDQGNDRLDGGRGDDILFGGAGGDTLNGGDGYDIVSYADASAGVTADMANPHLNTESAFGDEYISIEHLIGSGLDDVLGASLTDSYLYGGGGLGNDTLNGNDGDDTLEGGFGADMFVGGGGIDTVTYSNATTGLALDLGNSSRNTGEALGDTHAQIENIIGTDFADDLRATGFANTIHAGAGDDFVLARSGDDAVFGEAGDDRIEGGNGNDTLEGGQGADILNGGEGLDSAAYATAVAGVSVDLSNASRNTGDALGDNYISIENLIGSDFNDDLRATGGENTVFAGAGNDFVLARSGNDLVHGEAGNDRIEGGNGDDTLGGGTGLDILTGGAGADVFVFDDGDTGVDEVTDFASGLDLLDVSAWGASSTSELSISAASNGGVYDVSVAFGGNAFELLEFSQTTLSDADFIFV